MQRTLMTYTKPSITRRNLVAEMLTKDSICLPVDSDACAPD